MTREEAKREMLFAKREVMSDSWIDKAYDAAIKALEQPEIIRCKDCKHGKYDIFDRGMLCELHPSFDVTEDDFCSRAERRTDD